MAKREILFNDEVYSIEESVIEASLAEMKSRLVDSYSGSGTTIVYDGTTINVDSAKLAAAASNLAAMLNRFAGSGANIVVNGVTYGIDSAKLNSANTKLHVTLSDLQSGGGGGSDEPTDAELNEYGFYYDMPYSAEIEQGITYHVVLKEGGVGELYATIAAELAAELFGTAEAMEGVPASVLMGAEMSPSWTLLEDGTLLFDMAGDGSQQMPFIVADNGLALTVIDGGEPMFNFVCTFEEYSDIYFEQTYYSCTAEFPDFIFKADGSAIAGGQVYPAGTLTYGPHKISLGGDSVLVSMNGKDLYLGGTKIGSMTPPCIHEYQEIGCECLTNSTHERITICTKCGAQFTTEEEHIDSNGDDICDKCGWDANTRIAGLYETGSTKLIASWYKLLKDGYIVVENGIIFQTPWSLQGDLVISNSVTSIGSSAFGPDDSLTSITIPDSVTSIGDHAFQKCSSLTSITIPDSVTSIGDSAFYNCSNLTNVNIGNGVTKIGYQAFYGCSSLTSINIPDSVTSIGDGAFTKCSSLASLTIPGSVTSIDEYAFVDCTGLTSITLPDSLRSIGDCAFKNCTSLTSITIPDSVTSIGDYVFKGCSNLTNVIIGNGVTSLGVVFDGCTGLTSLTIPFTGASLNGSNNTHFGYIFGAINYYANADEVPASLTTVTVTGGIINDKTFYYCSGLTNVTIGSGVTSIGKAFASCPNLTSITLERGITGIDSETFIDCTSLTNITIPDSVTSIGDRAFYNCSSLTNITIPNSVTSIGVQVFERSGLTNIPRLDNLTSIPSLTFSSCEGLTDITIPDTITKIETGAFYSCSGLTNATIGSGVTIIGEGAFKHCKKLANITFRGTMAQWRNIGKSLYWKYEVPATYVQCSDGQVAL